MAKEPSWIGDDEAEDEDFVEIDEDDIAERLYELNNDK